MVFKLKISQSEEQTLRNILNEYDIDYDNLHLTRKDINNILNPNSLFNSLMNEGYAHDVLSVTTGNENVRQSRRMLNREINKAKSISEITNMFRMLNRVERQSKTKKFGSALSIYAFMEDLIQS